MERILEKGDSWLDKTVLPKELEKDFKTVWNLHPEERGKVHVFGEKTIPRYQQAYLNDYTFSGVNSQALPLPNILQDYLDWVNTLYETNFNQVLVNWYENGLHFIGSHRDDERQLVRNSPIVTISLGAERTFRIRDNDKKIVKDIVTKDGIVLVMGGTFQKDFKHEIVKINGKKGESVGPRISLTFRQFL